MSLPRFSWTQSGEMVRTAECEDPRCGATFSWSSSSRQKFCPRCKRKRKKESDRGRMMVVRAPVPATPQHEVETSPDIGAAVGFDCLHLPERCTRQQCRHHMGTDIGTPDCAVRAANEHPSGIELVHIGRWMGVTRERIRQIEFAAIQVIRRNER